MKHLQPNEERFLEYLLLHYSFNNGPNKEAAALFAAIQFAFKNNVVNQNEAISVPWELLEMLAACTSAALESDSNTKILWDQGDNDYILPRTLKAFIAVIWRAQKDDQLVNRDGKIFLGTFEIPEWFWDTEIREFANIAVG